MRVPDPIDVTVVGIVTYGQNGEYDSISGSTWVGFTTERAAELLLGQPGKTTEIAMAAEPGVSQIELVERVQPLLPDGIEAVTGQQIEDEFKSDLESDFIGFFETFLLVFAGIALLVATFSIYNTFAIIVAQRTRESALLRALGASRRQVLRSITLEAIAVGVVAARDRHRRGDRSRERHRGPAREHGPRAAGGHRGERPHDHDLVAGRRGHHVARQRGPGRACVAGRPAGGAA